MVVIRLQKGFTFVELMIVVVIVGILAGVTVPLGALWISQARISGVEGEIAVAVGKAKGSAIRNQFGVVANNPVTTICIDQDGLLTVLESTAANLPSCDTATGNEVWRAELSSKVELSVAGNALACLCFNSIGVLTDTGCASCELNNRLTLTSGSRSETVFLN